MAGFGLYIFDLDGTLVDSFGDLVRTVNRVLGELGLGELPPQQVSGYIGQGARFLLARSLEAAGADPQRWLEPAREHFYPLYAKHMLDHTVFYEGVEETLEALAHSGVKLALCTNKPMELTQKMLTALGWNERFLWCLGGDSLARKKPDPMPLLHILERAEVPASRTLMVGDSVFDIAAGKAAGVWTCGVTYGGHAAARLQEEGAHFLIDDFAQVKTLQPPSGG